MSSLQTRCPACQTLFRVAEEQLAIKNGSVRCGQCRLVFNANEHLVAPEEDVPMLTEIIASEPAPINALKVEETKEIEQKKAPLPEKITENVSAKITLNSAENLSKTSPTHAFDKARVETPKKIFNASEIGAQHVINSLSSEKTPEKALEFDISTFDENVTEPLKTLENPLVSAPETALEAHKKSTNEDNATTNIAAQQEQIFNTVKEDALHQNLPQALKTPAENIFIAAMPTQNDGAIYAAKAPKIEPPFWVNLTWMLTGLCFVLVLAAQMLVHFRGEIAVRLPALRPSIELLSNRFDLSMNYPQQTELVSIETSDLQTDSEKHILHVSATLRNKAATAQAYPALELTLTDQMDQVLVRRIFTASDYLSSATRNKKLFAANSDVSVFLSLEAKNLQAIGYRLEVFYP